MRVEFILNNIVDLNMIYKSKRVIDDDWGEVTQTSYVGDEYSKAIIEALKLKFGEIKEATYLGQTGRVANETYTIITPFLKYSIIFTIDSYEQLDNMVNQLRICISSDQSEVEYDSFLEKLKIYLKDSLLKEWQLCTWEVDEQSEYLGMCLYSRIFKIENNIRAFINRVLTFHFGVEWFSLFGFEDIIKSYEKTKADFKRGVPEFNNINDILISTTMELLFAILLKLKIYETAIDLADSESLRLHKMISENNANSIADTVRKARKVKIDLWRDVFSKYFDSGEDAQKTITVFIKNRNHVAHNKLLTKSAYEKMLSDVNSVGALFDNASIKFNDEEPSTEMCQTMQAEQEQAEQEQEYIWGRIKDETGIEIRTENEIFELFESLLDDFYNELDDSEYFNFSVFVSAMSVIQKTAEKQIAFSVNSKVDMSYNFDICICIDINEGMDQESYFDIWAEKRDSAKILETKVIYHNGDAHEDVMEGYYIPDSESFVDDDSLREFIEEIKSYIKNEMNELKNEVDSIAYMAIKDGGDSPVADFPCYYCNQEYISICDDIYPYGHCIFCGEKNEIRQCIRCYTIYSEDEGDKDFCGYCRDKLEKE